MKSIFDFVPNEKLDPLQREFSFIRRTDFKKETKLLLYRQYTECTRESCIVQLTPQSSNFSHIMILINPRYTFLLVLLFQVLAIIVVESRYRNREEPTPTRYR